MKVNLGVKSYEIKIARGLLADCGGLIKHVTSAHKVAVVSDDIVFPLYGEKVLLSLRQAGFQVQEIVIPHGETSKSMEMLNYLYGKLADFGLSRADLLVTLGGGVVGDLGGLAAATFLRGLDFVQIPTTLLAQVDSSVGGKVAIDLPQGKNLVGAFYQPKLVVIDPEVLATLEPRVLHDGLAEVIKYGCIKDEGIFSYLEQVADDSALLAGIEFIIEKSCGIKGEIVAQDEFDKGQRMLLNFGHTLGHGVEQAGAYTRFTHGEGVGLGMLAVTRATEQLGLTAAGTGTRIEKLLHKFNLPCQCEYTLPELLQGIMLDKKRHGDKITIVVLEGMGRGKLLEVSLSDLPKYFVL